MITLTASLQLVTPAFLGGADHRADGIRLTALKSALRWWWRAQQWAHLRAQAASDKRHNVTDARKKLWDEEMALFGSASYSEAGQAKGGQGVFLMRLVNSNCEAWNAITANRWKPKGRSSGLAYLLGQGLWDKNDFANGRNALATGEFTVEFLFRPIGHTRDAAAVAKEVDQVANALWLLCHLGGFGARARRGWGSLCMTSLAIEGLQSSTALPQPAQDAKTMVHTLQTLLPSKMDKDYPPLTAFSVNAQVSIVSLGHTNAADELSAAGQYFQAFRRTFSAYDALLVREYSKGMRPTKHPQRVVFGLGHNYFMPADNVSVGITPSKESDRRASPLLIHLHQWPGSKKFSVVYSLLPAKFLPDNAQIVYTDQYHRRGDLLVDRVKNDDFWKPAYEFMQSHMHGASPQFQAAWPAVAYQ